jgi:phage shock protein PspC (stress-responsive transcriptional regulator)
MEGKKILYRDTDNQRIAGVCSGLSDYLDIDVTVIRIIWIFLLLFGGTGLIAYIVMAIVIEPKSVVMKREAEKQKVVNDDPFAKYDRK